MNCLIKKVNCSLQDGDAPCSKCGLSRKDRFVDSEAKERAQDQARQRYEDFDRAVATEASKFKPELKLEPVDSVSGVSPAATSTGKLVFKVLAVLLIVGAIAWTWGSLYPKKAEQPVAIATPTPEVAPAPPESEALREAAYAGNQIWAGSYSGDEGHLDINSDGGCKYSNSGVQVYFEITCLGKLNGNHYEIYWQKTTNGAFYPEEWMDKSRPWILLFYRSSKLYTQFPQVKSSDAPKLSFRKEMPPTEDDDVVINGRGQVLVSGNPNKKVLRCVEDHVENEKKYSDGWDARIIAECNKLKIR